VACCEAYVTVQSVVNGLGCDGDGVTCVHRYGGCILGTFGGRGFGIGSQGAKKG